MEGGQSERWSREPHRRNAAAAVADTYNKVGAGVDKVFAGIGAEIVKAAKDRITNAAGYPEKARKAHEIRDMSEERSAQIEAQMEQALADELRARLSMATEVQDRADIERQIATATANAKQSRIDAQIAAIADEKGLSHLKKAELTLKLQRIKFIEGGIADIQRQAINEKELADLIAEASAEESTSRGSNQRPLGRRISSGANPDQCRQLGWRDNGFPRWSCRLCRPDLFSGLYQEIFQARTGAGTSDYSARNA